MEDQIKQKKINKTVTNVIYIFLSIAVVASLTVVFMRYFSSDENVYNPATGKYEQKKKEVKKAICPLDGTEVAETIAFRRPLAIMVENHPDARPQSGLDKASIVYEAITEGGITRFMAIFGPNDSQKVGPVRSARTYYIDWLSEFNAFFAHVGGNLDALDKIKTDRVLDLDEFGVGKNAYWREEGLAKAIEHTMYTSTEKLYNYARQKGWSETDKSYQTFKFDNKLKQNGLPNKSVTIDFSTASYKVDWQYDASRKVYLREMAGSAHFDNETGDQLSGDNIIIQSVDRWDTTTTSGEQGFTMLTIGSGKAKVFIDGQAIDGTWKKNSRTSRTLFYNQLEEEITFKPGKTWVEIVPPEVFNTLKVQ